MEPFIMNKKINTQEVFYNARWKDFNHINSLKLKRCIAILEGISSIDMKYPSILDLGSGNGWLTSILDLLGPTVGIDLSDVAIQNSQERYPHAYFINADILNWDFKGEKFDIIVSQEVIEHVEDQKKYIHIIHNLLRPGGYLILTTPNKKMFEAFPKDQQILWSNQPIENWLSMGDLEKLILPVFSIIKIKTIISGFDAKGIFRYLNSYKVKKIMRILNLSIVYENLYLYLGFGLHLFLIAKKK